MDPQPHSNKVIPLRPYRRGKSYAQIHNGIIDLSPFFQAEV